MPSWKSATPTGQRSRITTDGNAADAGTAGATSAGPLGQSPLGRREFVTLLAAITATTALGIDFILPAFGEIRQDLDLSSGSSRVALTVTVYFFGLALTQSIYGPLADRFGRKPILWLGLGIYLAGAIGSGLAPSFGWLLLARGVWGIGAAGPRALAVAIARDLFEEEQLARILATAVAIFMIVPAIAPLLGQGVLAISNWRLTIAAPALLALALLLWTTRLPESLPTSERRPLTLDSTRRAFTTVIRTRSTLGFALALMFDFGSFASFLATSELLFRSVYDRGDQFPLAFGAMSVFMGLFVMTGTRSIGRFEPQRMILSLLAAGVVGSLALAVVSAAGGGAPNFWIWFGLITIVNSIRTLSNALVNARAMAPMGAMAGTAAAAIGTMSMGGGALLAAVTDRFLSDSVTPLAMAYLGYGTLGFMAALWASTDRRWLTAG